MSRPRGPRTECKRGHPNIPENKTPAGQCIPCRHIWHLKSYKHRGRGLLYQKGLCARGHRMTPDNTRHKKKGRRQCLECYLDNQKKHKKKLSDLRAGMRAHRESLVPMWKRPSDLQKHWNKVLHDLGLGHEIGCHAWLLYGVESWNIGEKMKDAAHMGAPERARIR